MKKQVTWETKTGKNVMVTIELQTTKRVWLDGDESFIKCCEMNIMAEVDGMGIVGSGRPVKANHPEAVAKIGKLGITADQLKAINQAIDEVESSLEWQEKQAKIEKSIAIERDYEYHVAKMNKIMGE